MKGLGFWVEWKEEKRKMPEGLGHGPKEYLLPLEDRNEQKMTCRIKRGLERLVFGLSLSTKNL